MSLIDQPGEVRASERLDLEKLDNWLKQQLPTLKGTPTVKQFAGGASNLTYQLNYDNQTLILRRPPFGHKAKSAHDMLREADVMRQLKPVYPWVPKVHATCNDDTVLSCEFYVMEKLVGIIPRRELPAGLSLDEQQVRRLCQSVLDKLIALHQVDYQAAGLSGLGKGEGYVARQIGGWSKRYRAARTPDVPDCEEVMTWLDAHQPADVATCIIHNDFRFDNVVLSADNPLEVIGVLDWEMATLGDPLMELGCVLSYWVQADDEPYALATRMQPTHLPGMFTRKEVAAYYLEKTGFKANHFDFYLVYGYFRLAGILQQIYARFYHGETDNPRFAQFGGMVAWLEGRCLELMA
jgi:aminoglycoside phosphotransferase (APT) family kinase protein